LRVKNGRELSKEELIIPKSTESGIAEEATEELIDRINARDSSRPQPQNHQQKEKRNKTLYKELLEGKLDQLSETAKQTIEPLLINYAHVFHDEHTDDFKGTDVIEHQILLDDTRPTRKPQYRVPYSLRKEMQTQVEEMLKKGVIRESNSPWAAPALLVTKKSTYGKPKFRFCVDFRSLNSVTKFDTYLYQFSKRRRPLCTVPNSTAFLTATLAFGRTILRRITKKGQPLQSHPDLTNSTSYPLACPVAHRVFNDSWTWF
jgi:hypothetical protein